MIVQYNTIVIVSSFVKEVCNLINISLSFAVFCQVQISMILVLIYILNIMVAHCSYS